MAKIAKLRYVQGWLDRKDGVTYYYVRRRGFKLVRLRGLPGSQEFMKSYQRALAQAPLKIGAGRPEGRKRQRRHSAVL